MRLEKAWLVFTVKEKVLVTRYWSTNGVQAVSPSLDIFSLHEYVCCYHVVDFVITLHMPPLDWPVLP